jgi:GST-like protein
MACYPWIDVYKDAPLDLQPYPELRRWRESIRARPATQRAYALRKQVGADAGKPLDDDQRKILFGQGTPP